MIVIAIIAVLAAIALPRLSVASWRAKVLSAQKTVISMEKIIQQEYAITESWPGGSDTIFADSVLQANPLVPSGSGLLEVHSLEAAVFHPVQKMSKAIALKDGWWYSQSSGSFRARVPSCDTVQETISLYNDINTDDVSTIGQSVFQ